jgi:hypothetical protein
MESKFNYVEFLIFGPFELVIEENYCTKIAANYLND